MSLTSQTDHHMLCFVYMLGGGGGGGVLRNIWFSFFSLSPLFPPSCLLLWSEPLMKYCLTSQTDHQMLFCVQIVCGGGGENIWFSFSSFFPSLPSIMFTSVEWTFDELLLHYMKRWSGLTSGYFLAQRQMLKSIWSSIWSRPKRHFNGDWKCVYWCPFSMHLQNKNRTQKDIAIYLIHAGNRFTICSSLVIGKNHYN